MHKQSPTAPSVYTKEARFGTRARTQDRAFQKDVQIPGYFLTTKPNAYPIESSSVLNVCFSVFDSQDSLKLRRQFSVLSGNFPLCLWFGWKVMLLRRKVFYIVFHQLKPRGTQCNQQPDLFPSAFISEVVPERNSSSTSHRNNSKIVSISGRIILSVRSNPSKETKPRVQGKCSHA